MCQLSANCTLHTALSSSKTVLVNHQPYTLQTITVSAGQYTPLKINHEDVLLNYIILFSHLGHLKIPTVCSDHVHDVIFFWKVKGNEIVMVKSDETIPTKVG